MTVGVPDMVLKTGVTVEVLSSFTVTQGSKAVSMASAALGCRGLGFGMA